MKGHLTTWANCWSRKINSDIPRPWWG